MEMAQSVMWIPPGVAGRITRVASVPTMRSSKPGATAADPPCTAMDATAPSSSRPARTT
jgi:hypothetical protein